MTFRHKGAIIPSSKLVLPDPTIELGKIMARNPGSRVIRTERSPDCEHSGIYYSCSSHIGPLASDGKPVKKSNEDYAFATELKTDEGIWLIGGVADGVSSSIWSDLGSMLASISFIETMQKIIDERFSLAEIKSEFSNLFLSTWNSNVRYLFDKMTREGAIPPGVPEYDYKNLHTFDRFFHTTILAGALGPEFGLMLVHGDGIIEARANGLYQPASRIIRTTSHEAPLQLSPDMSDKVAVETLEYEPDMRNFEIRCATDGVNNSYGNRFRESPLRSNKEADTHLENLAKSQYADKDNMAIALLHRRILGRSTTDLVSMELPGDYGSVCMELPANHPK